MKLLLTEGFYRFLNDIHPEICLFKGEPHAILMVTIYFHNKRFLCS